jgi:hypothetical protein
MSTIKKNIAASAAAAKKGISATNPAALAFYLKVWESSIAAVEATIASSERMHSASLDANTNLLTCALKGAETVDAEQFTALVVALKEVSLAGIEAQRAVSMEVVANGRGAIKALEGVSNAAITAFAPVAMAQAQAQATRASAEVMNAETRSEEAEIKKHTAETERLKAETARETARQARYTNGASASAI